MSKLLEENNVYIIAELSANHLNNYDIAMKSIEEISKTGVDAVKIQTLTPDTMTINCDNEYFRAPSNTPWAGRSLYDLYSETPLPYDWHYDIFKIAKELGLECFSTPYDISSVKFLSQFEPELYKISSFEITDLNLIKYVAEKGKPILISTGIAYINEIQEAVDVCRDVGNEQIYLLHCVSSYPAPIEKMNLKMINNISSTFNVDVGLSDHSIDDTAAIVAVAMGAKIIEKHFILDRNLGGPDALFSIEPDEFKRLVIKIRNAQKSLGNINYTMTNEKLESRQFSRSLFIVRDVEKGKHIQCDDIRSIRPGSGISPKYFNQVVGKTAVRNLKRGEPVNWGMFYE